MKSGSSHLAAGAHTLLSLQEKLEKAALWVCAGLTTAFFSSLEVCACVKVQTDEQYARVSRRSYEVEGRISRKRQRPPTSLLNCSQCNVDEEQELDDNRKLIVNDSHPVKRHKFIAYCG
ncbi:hypothetical protein GOP47_0025568 [Adiantum capillus-veneris]|uniref:Uncharacterized protein n=1 Tax=Adiantum capillus-veneris TaxID=13818 RepID=A0A9D4U2C1_ADICA|nr:hypothetical protein GOP47_0025568 [Adiantum capillus-veneris]